MINKINGNSWRIPDEREYRELAEYIRNIGIPAEIDEIKKSSSIIILENYTSKGYTGKLMMVIYLQRNHYEMFAWDKGELIEINNDVFIAS